MEYPGNLLVEMIETQKKTNELLEKLISVVAAAAISDATSGIDPFTRQNAAVYAKKIFSKRYQNGE
jgi:hypothetical protein